MSRLAVVGGDEDRGDEVMLRRNQTRHVACQSSLSPSLPGFDAQ